MRKFLFVFVLALIVAGAPSSAHATLCNKDGLEGLFYSYHLVFKGRLVSNKGVLNIFEPEGSTLVFDVQEVFKGDKYKTVSVVKWQPSGHRRVGHPRSRFTGIIGQYYIVGVSSQEQAVFGICNEPMLIDTANEGEVIHKLREMVEDYRQRKIIYEAERQALQYLLEEKEKYLVRVKLLDELLDRYPEPESALRVYKAALHFFNGQYDLAQKAVDDYKATAGNPEIMSFSREFSFKNIRRAMIHELQIRIFFEKEMYAEARGYIEEVLAHASPADRSLFQAWHRLILHETGGDIYLYHRGYHKQGVEKISTESLLNFSRRVVASETNLTRFYPLDINKAPIPDSRLFNP